MRQFILIFVLIFGGCQSPSIQFQPPMLSPSVAQSVLMIGGCGARTGEFSHPQGFCIDFEGNILVADTGNHRIQIFRKSGEFYTEFGNFGTQSGQFNYPTDIATDGLYLYVADSQNQRIQRFDAQRLTFVDIVLSAETTHTDLQDIPPGVLESITISKSGLIAVSDPENNRVILLDNRGRIQQVIGGKEPLLKYPLKPFFSRDQKLYIPDQEHDMIFIFNHQGLGLLDVISVEGIIGLAEAGTGHLYIAQKQGNEAVVHLVDSSSFVELEKVVVGVPFRAIVVKNDVLYQLNSDECLLKKRIL